MNHECETCKHTELNGCDYPCRWCSVVYPNTGFSDMWEQDGCDFCNGYVNEFGFCGVEVGYFKIEIWKDEHQDVDSEFYLNVLHILHAADEENLKINYCPMCGKRL